MKYQIPEPGMTISGFADSYYKKKKKLMPTDPIFFWHVTVNTHIFFFGLICDLISFTDTVTVLLMESFVITVTVQIVPIILCMRKNGREPLSLVWIGIQWPFIQRLVMKINNSYLFDITLFAIQLFRVSFLVKFEPQSGQTKNYKIGICCFSAKHAALQSKSKDWLDQNRDKMLCQWSDTSFLGFLFQWEHYKNLTKRSPKRT